MSNSRRDVEHVARLEHPGVLGSEPFQDAEIEAGLVVGGGPPVDLPSSPALALDQEDIVAVDVGVDRSVKRREAHHHIVHSPSRNEREG